MVILIEYEHTTKQSILYFFKCNSGARTRDQWWYIKIQGEWERVGGRRYGLIGQGDNMKRIIKEKISSYVKAYMRLQLFVNEGKPENLTMEPS